MIPLPMLPASAVNQLKPCRHGHMLYNSRDPIIGRSLELYGEFTEHEIELFAQLVGAGDLVVDVGANIGTHTVALAGLVGPTGAVLSFEPQRLIYQILCANLALNSLTNGYAHNVALGAEAGVLRVPRLDYASPQNFGAVSLEPDEGFGDLVQVTPLDSFDLPACRLLKIDVEGMEIDVLRGATTTLRRHRPVLYVENNQPDKSGALIRHIDSLDYVMYWHIVPYYNPRNYFRNSDDELARYRPEPNMLCLPQEAEQELTGFERVEVPPRDG